MKISPGGQNQVVLGVKIEWCLGSKLSASTQIQCLFGRTLFWPQAALYLDRSSTWFWPPGHIFITEKSYKSQVQRDLYFFSQAIHLIKLLRFKVKSIFLLGNLFNHSNHNIYINCIHIHTLTYISLGNGDPEILMRKCLPVC